jgi:hypothetical protein
MQLRSPGGDLAIDMPALCQCIKVTGRMSLQQAHKMVLALETLTQDVRALERLTRGNTHSLTGENEHLERAMVVLREKLKKVEDQVTDASFHLNHSSLNQDVHVVVQRHVLLTLKLAVDDNKKFDLSTLKRGSWAYHRILEVVPNSNRIIHDVDKVVESMLIVKSALGVHCPGVGSRNYGVRHIKVDRKRSGGGGHRKKALDDYNDAVVHPDTKHSVKMKIEDSLARADGKNSGKLAKWMKEDSPKVNGHSAKVS